MCGPDGKKGKELVSRALGSVSSERPQEKEKKFLKKLKNLGRSGQDNIITSKSISCSNEAEKARLIQIMMGMAQEKGMDMNEFSEGLEFGELLDIANSNGIQGFVVVTTAKKVLMIHGEARALLDKKIDEYAKELGMLPIQLKSILTFQDWVDLADETEVNYQADLYQTSMKVYSFQEAMLFEATEEAARKKKET